MKILAALIIGVAVLGVASCESHQSELTTSNEEPIKDQGIVGKREETPEVVLQLNYDRGELDRIYLTQFRKPTKPWSPSVSVQTNLCADLCHAGLGGDVCGPTCDQLLPVGLKSALINANTTDVVYGEPRVAVCPALCNNHLGNPLCQCTEDEDGKASEPVDWTAVCDAFCTDGYAMIGCPPCEVKHHQPVVAAVTTFRALDTAEGWQLWCNVQCPQGNGGLACNCDRNPFT